MDPGYRYGGEALFFIGIAMRLIPWLIRTSREVQESGDQSPWGWGAALMRPKPTALGSVAPLTASMTPEQQARVIAMITETPTASMATAGHEVEHRCPKCGTLIHADIVHGGFGPCRKCGWTPEQQQPQ